MNPYEPWNAANRRARRAAYDGIYPTTRNRDCGSESGYQSHRYRHEFACADCREAHSKHNVERRTLRRAS